MIVRRRPRLVLAVYPQTRSFAYALFERWLAPVDWGVHEVRGGNKNARCLQRIESIFALHTPDVVLLQDVSEHRNRRAIRIQQLNRDIIELAELRGIAVCMYRRSNLRQAFASSFDATTKQRIAETIAYQLPALALYIPPARRPWMSEHQRMGIFEAAALAWMYFHINRG